MAVAIWACVAWLVISEIGRITSGGQYPGAAVAGFIAGLVLPRVAGLVAFTAGVAASYPIAWALGRIAFLGDAWLVLTVLLVAISWAGFAVGALVSRWSSRIRQAA